MNFGDLKKRDELYNIFSREHRGLRVLAKPNQNTMKTFIKNTFTNLDCNCRLTVGSCQVWDNKTVERQGQNLGSHSSWIHACSVMTCNLNCISGNSLCLSTNGKNQLRVCQVRLTVKILLHLIKSFRLRWYHWVLLKATVATLLIRSRIKYFIQLFLQQTKFHLST